MRFTEQAQQTLEVAQEEARNLNHDWVGTEHLLLGLARRLYEHSPHGLPELRKASPNVTPEAVRAMVLFVVPPAAISPSGDVSSRGKDPQFTPRMNQVLQHSSQVSLNLGNDRVGDEHLLLGALYDKGGVAEQVLHELGVAYETVYELVASKPGTPPAEKSETSAAPMPILPPSQVRMTPGAVRVFEIARQQAEDDELTDGMLSTHHYLLALMIEGAFSTEGGLAAKVLNSFGITYGSLIARIDELGVEGTSDAFDWSASPPPHNDAT